MAEATNVPPDAEPVDDPDRRRITISHDGLVAELVYRADDERLVILHTQTPDAWRGQGVGGKLVAAAVDRAERDQLIVVPWCPFTRKWLEEHDAEVAGRVSIDFDSNPAKLQSRCAHVVRADPAPVPDPAEGCAECLEEGSRWVHLRICLACGHVGCCDSSPRKHATAHHRSEGHPLVRSYEPGENWWWCYVDEEAFEVGGAPSAPSYA